MTSTMISSFFCV